MTRRCALAFCLAALCGGLAWHALIGCTRAAAKPRVAKMKGVPIFPAGDNSLCFVCHIDFDGEELVTTHVDHGVTCASCHGECNAHMSDEMIMTKPDILYGRAEVDRFCRKCHAKHKSPEAVEGFRAEWQGRHLPNGRSVADDSPCTDCHGKHVIFKPGMTR